MLVSILVLMDSRVKTKRIQEKKKSENLVSILVLMDSRVKTIICILLKMSYISFNPCFNG